MYSVAHKRTFNDLSDKVRALASNVSSSGSPKSVKLYAGVAQVVEIDLVTSTQVVKSREKAHQDGSVYSLHVHDQDRSLLFAGRHSGSIDMIDTRSMTIVAQLQEVGGHTDVVKCIISSPQGAHQILSGSYDGTVKLWDLKKHKIVVEQPQQDSLSSAISMMCSHKHKGPVHSIVYCAANSTFCTCSQEGIVQFATKGSSKCVQGASDELLCMSLSHGNIFAGCKDGTLMAYQESDLGCSQVLFPQHSMAVTCMALSSSSSGIIQQQQQQQQQESAESCILASGSADQCVKLWSTEYPYMISEVQTSHKEPIRSISWVLDRLVVTGSQDKSIQLFQVKLS